MVINTLMSNIGLTMAFDRLGIDHKTADVGDRRVMEKMKSTGAILGGEDSGHIIFLDQHTTGDGLLSALRLMEVIVRQKKPLSQLARIMMVAPQTLINVIVSSKPDLREVASIRQIISQVESELKGQGRVLVRYSGTQPLCRVMVEGPTPNSTDRYCRMIAQVVAKTIGESSQ
jgi:phosphoglucosamine mutase